MGCSTTAVRYLMFAFNLLFAIAGAAILVVGLLLHMNFSYIKGFIPEEYNLAMPPLLLIIIGGFIFVTATFGCCGAHRRSTCMLCLYAVILLTLLVVQVIIATYAFVQIGDTAKLQTSVRQVVEQSFKQYNSSEASQQQFNILQTSLKCCGVKGAYDWKWANNKVPSSCCPEKSTEECKTTSLKCYKDGCADKAYKWFKRSLDALGIVAIVVASVEMIGAILALCLSSSIKNQMRREVYA